MNAGSPKPIAGEIDIIPFQLHQQYIIFQIKSGYILIDQQGAHQRILFEQFLQTFKRQAVAKQQLLFPHTIELNSEDAEILKAISADVSLLGYDIEDFGNNAFIMRAVPADLEDGNHQQAIDDFIEQFKIHSQAFEVDQRTELAKSLARSAGIKKGKKLSREEMKNMIDSLFACDTPYLSPYGHPTLLTYSLHDLENQFRKKN
jgi:DNA mismatch repair protein MutL